MIDEPTTGTLDEQTDGLPDGQTDLPTDGRTDRQTDGLPDGLATVPHSGIVAIVGRTNAGKSTLVNRIVGEKVSIVTPVVQTTRNNIHAILTDDRGQLVLIDTPGLHKSQSRLGTVMNKMARSAIEGVDTLLVVFDGSRDPQLEDDGWMRRALFAESKVVFLLNKRDAGLRREAFEKLWADIQAEKEHTRDVSWMECSAASGTGVAEVVQALFESLPPGPLLYDEETLTDHPRKIAIADAIREKYFLLLDDELPHSIGIKIDEIREEGETWYVDATLYVKRFGQKGIVLGPKGRMLRAVKRRAEPELSEAYGVDVHLNIWVRVEKDWDENHFLLKQMGYVK